MTARLEFDDRLLNPYAVEDLAASHPTLHAALRAWFSAFGDLDDRALLRLIAAKSPADVDRFKPAGEAALASIPGVVASLDAVIRELEATRPGDELDAARLDALREAARANRSTLVERAPALVAAAVSAASDYDQARLAATAAVERTAERLEALRAQSDNPNASFRSLQPLVAELQAAWSGLDRALASLSRQDQRSVREPLEARMQTAARALTRNLFLAKTRDRAAGTWPVPEIPRPGDSTAERFAAALARRDVDGARAMIAPWLAGGWTVAHLSATLDRAAREIVTGVGLPQAPPVGAFQVGANPMRYEDVRSSETLAAVVPPEVTPTNYRGWFRIELQTDQEDAYLTDVDCLARLDAVVVDTPDGERIGHLGFET